MAKKQKKKRNKSYSGSDSASSRPNLTRVQAEDVNKLTLWWRARKQYLKPIIKTSAVVLIVVFLLYELIRIVSTG